MSDSTDYLNNLQNKFLEIVSPTRILKPGEVDIWSVGLDRSAATINDLTDILSRDEKRKAKSFYFRMHRDNYIVVRGTLRNLLGEYLNMEPNHISFCYNPDGKPFLEADACSLRFNVSHSGGLALLAFTCGREIGVDLEFIDGTTDVGRLAKYFFSESEINEFESISPNLQNEAFFSFWTRKEACLKAVGNGFSIEPKNFAVPYSGKEIISYITQTGAKVCNWSVMTLPSDKTYKAALAVEGQIGTVRYLSC